MSCSVEFSMKKSLIPRVQIGLLLCCSATVSSLNIVIVYVAGLARIFTRERTRKALIRDCLDA